MDKRLAVYVWAEHCALGGHSVAQHHIEDHDGDPLECADWVCFYGTPEELVTEATLIEEIQVQHPNLYRARVARVLRAAAGV